MTTVLVSRPYADLGFVDRRDEHMFYVERTTKHRQNTSTLSLGHLLGFRYYGLLVPTYLHTIGLFSKFMSTTSRNINDTTLTVIGNS